MASSTKPLKSKHRVPFILSLLILFIPLLFLYLNFRPPPKSSLVTSTLSSKLILEPQPQPHLPEWFNLIERTVTGRKVKVGLVNVDNEGPDSDVDLDSEFLDLKGLAEVVDVKFDPIPETLKWKDFFPEWIDEEEKFHRPTCPKIPIPNLEEYDDLDVVVARAPCGSNNNGKVGVRDLLRLQVNLVAAHLAVASGRAKMGQHDRAIHVVFIGPCKPMVEIFRCDDLVRKAGDYWLYRPDQGRLEQKVMMPVGSCELASPHEVKYGTEPATRTEPHRTLSEAYVTVLHSSEAYVCGAIALAQSIKRTNSTHDLVLLADDSITNRSRSGLAVAGWKIITIKRIRSPHAAKGAYNAWNYSKFRVWQLTQYDKLIFIDADLIVLRNIDHFFSYTQLSAAKNDKVLFNSGVMVLQPSSCVFEELMVKISELGSYNGGDQGFLNEFFTWWHRLPSKLNFLKNFGNPKNTEHRIPENLYTIHYLGFKPWMCYRDYDCNWDEKHHHIFASDMANEKWWEVYDFMPKELQRYCGLTKRIDFQIRKWRGVAKNLRLPNGHWKIKVTDPRRHRIAKN